jgi:Spy/CpxP family protein refolding chaperone
MLKKYLLTIFAAGLLAIGATFAAAQDNPAPAQAPSTDQQPAPGNGRMRHAPPDPAQRTAELTKKLSLTADQQTKVQGILESEHSQMETLRQDSSAGPDRRSKMMDIHKSSDTQIRALLDPDQQKKWDEMQAKRQEWMQKRGGRMGNTGDQQAPPPQQ